MCLYGQSLCLCFLTLEVSWQAGLGLVVAYDQREGAAARHTEGGGGAQEKPGVREGVRKERF